MLEIWTGHSPLATPVVTSKERKRKNSTYLMFNLPLTKSSQQRKTARHCKTSMKSNIVSIGCYICLLPTRLPGNRDCLLKICNSVKSARTVSREFYMKKRVYITLNS